MQLQLLNCMLGRYIEIIEKYSISRRSIASYFIYKERELCNAKHNSAVEFVKILKFINLKLAIPAHEEFLTMSENYSTKTPPLPLYVASPNTSYFDVCNSAPDTFYKLGSPLRSPEWSSLRGSNLIALNHKSPISLSSVISAGMSHCNSDSSRVTELHELLVELINLINGERMKIGGYLNFYSYSSENQHAPGSYDALLNIICTNIYSIFNLNDKIERYRIISKDSKVDYSVLLLSLAKMMIFADLELLLHDSKELSYAHKRNYKAAELTAVNYIGMSKVKSDLGNTLRQLFMARNSVYKKYKYTMIAYLDVQNCLAQMPFVALQPLKEQLESGAIELAEQYAQINPDKNLIAKAKEAIEIRNNQSKLGLCWSDSDNEQECYGADNEEEINRSPSSVAKSLHLHY